MEKPLELAQRAVFLSAEVHSDERERNLSERLSAPQRELPQRGDLRAVARAYGAGTRAAGNREKDAEIDRRFSRRAKGQAAQNNERVGKATKWSVRILHTAAGARI